ncbi:2864_t:CDS:2 [Rhizophagus irregularis]|nr:2864_t:CDS:2 [Rhizophagus irregularis]
MWFDLDRELYSVFGQEFSLCEHTGSKWKSHSKSSLIFSRYKKS